MPADLVTKVLRIKDCGHDEYWLRDQIADNPAILGLGDLVCVMKEKTQSQGGRIDLLLKDPEDESMFEVELQLGETDPSHIMRSIEYWDNQKRRWPKRSHTAVLVAEKITSRFFNVVQLLSKAVPIIGIQANMLQIGDSTALHFTTIIDSFEEEEVEESPQVDEKYWRDKSPAVLECATWYRELLTRIYGDVRMKLCKTMVTLYLDGTVRAAVWPIRNNRASVQIGKLDKETLAQADAQLNKERTVFTRKGDQLLFSGNLQQLRETEPAHEWIARKLSPRNAEVKA